MSGFKQHPAIHLTRVVHKVDNAIHQINHYPADSMVCFVNTYHWIAIYLVDSIIQPPNNPGLTPLFKRVDPLSQDTSLSSQG